MTKVFSITRNGILLVCLCVVAQGAMGQEGNVLPESISAQRLLGQRLQTPPLAGSRSISGVQPRLPVMPALSPRPSETSDQPFRRERQADERRTVSSWAETVTGSSDTVIELIVGQARVLTAKQPIPEGDGIPVISLGDPSVVDFDLLPDPRMLRITGNRVGVTDLTFITADGQIYSYEIHVLYDLPLVSAHLDQVFPDAQIELVQLREHVVVRGEARSSAQVSQILQTLRAYLSSIQTQKTTRGRQTPSRPLGSGRPAEPESSGDEESGTADPSGEDGNGSAESPDEDFAGYSSEEGGRPSTTARAAAPQIFNQLRVPSVQQVMLKVQIAELSRSAVREIGVDLTFASASGNFLQSIATGSGNLVGVFPNAEFDIVLNALRRNSVATILAEPNLVTLNGHVATFQAGGEFPVPVGSISNLTPSVEFKQFGVLLSFIPYVQDDDVIRLSVQPEVSSIDEALSVSIVEGGDAVPGLRTRNASTTVDLREGQTLAIAGLLSRDLGSSTARVPILGDLPFFGVLFSDRNHRIDERELVVVVTPYLVSGMNADQRPPLPGREISEPDDLEFYLLNRIEGRTGRPHRSALNWDRPCQMNLERACLAGPIGFTE